MTVGLFVFQVQLKRMFGMFISGEKSNRTTTSILVSRIVVSEIIHMYIEICKNQLITVNDRDINKRLRQLRNRLINNRNKEKRPRKRETDREEDIAYRRGADVGVLLFVLRNGKFGRFERVRGTLALFVPVDGLFMTWVRVLSPRSFCAVAVRFVSSECSAKKEK